MSDEVDWDAEVTTYLEHLLRGDRASAVAQVRDLRAAGLDIPTVIHRLLAPAQLRVGQHWLSDTWTVAQEHAATAISETVLAAIATDRDRAAQPPDADTVIVACVEQEWHALPALMVSEHLREGGFAVSYLGANLSTQGLVRQVHAVGPAAVLLSCSLSTYLPLVRRQVEAVRETGTPVLVGGSAFDAEGRRAATIGATGFARTAHGVAEIVRALPASVAPAPAQDHPGAAEGFTVFADRERIADEVSRLMRSSLSAEGVADASSGQSWLAVLGDQLPHVVGSVAGALVADDPRIVTEALGWVDEVLQHRSAPVAVGPALRAALAGALRELPVAARMVASRVTVD